MIIHVIGFHVYATYLGMKGRSSDEGLNAVHFGDHSVLLWLDRCHIVRLVLWLVVDRHIGAVDHGGLPTGQAGFFPTLPTT